MLLVVQNDPKVPVGAYGDYLEELGVPFQIVRPFLGGGFRRRKR